MGTRTREFKDYYRILEVPEAATGAEIKKSYRKLALEHHPDHNPGNPASEEKFKEISEAYGVLIDPLKRKEYDRFRAAYFAGRTSEESQFRYSQEDIFESMFRQGFSRDIFDDLNREFRRSGFRSGDMFYQTVFFGGALVGGLSRILSMIPGPVGRIGHGLRLAQMVGSSVLAYKRMRDEKGKSSPQDSQERPKEAAGRKAPPLVDSLKGMFIGKDSGERGHPLDLHFNLTIPASEALTGTRKRLSYKIGDHIESLRVHIPPNFPPGGKLRIREKGKMGEGQRGDLILTVHFESHPESKHQPQ